jgi:hypothetical protein
MLDLALLHGNAREMGDAPYGGGVDGHWNLTGKSTSGL